MQQVSDVPSVAAAVKTRQNSFVEGCVKVMQGFPSGPVISCEVFIKYVWTFVASVKWATSDKLLRDSSVVCSNF